MEHKFTLEGLNIKLLQHYCGPDSLLDITHDLHVNYAKRHNIDFITSDESLCELPGWDKLQMLLSCGESEGEILVFADHDCMIIGDELFSLSEGFDFGCVRNLWYDFNTGLIVMRNSQKSRDFLRRCLDLGEVDNPTALHEHTRFHRELHMVKIESLDSRWNFYCNSNPNPRRPIQVRAWHNIPKYLARSEMENLRGMLRRN